MLLPDSTPSDDTDNNTLTTYTSETGQALLTVQQDTNTGGRLATAYRYNAAGQQVYKALPSAFKTLPTSLSTWEENPDLLAFSGGCSASLENSTGIIELTAYGASDAATATSAGAAKGYVSSTSEKTGQTGTAVQTSSKDYVTRTAGGATTRPLNSETVPSRGTTAGRTTSYEYHWYGQGTTSTADDTTQPDEKQKQEQHLDGSQNPSGSPELSTEHFGIWGAIQWFRDIYGFLTYFY